MIDADVLLRQSLISRGSLANLPQHALQRVDLMWRRSQPALTTFPLRQAITLVWSLPNCRDFVCSYA
jgi:hypothetical protein